MRATETVKPSLGGLKPMARKALKISNDRLVDMGPLEEGRAIPWVVRPAVEGVDLMAWAAGHRDEVESLLREHRALLFRGFDVESVERLQELVKLTSVGEPLEYRDRSTPRHAVGERIYISTTYPSQETIALHNEGTYWQTWALKIYFCALVTAEEGGQTPIADTRRVLARIPAEIRRRFLEKHVLYVRNYNDGFGLSWQDSFRTSDRAEVESYCRKSSIDFEWKDGDRLRTRQLRPAVRRHPATGEPLWFNHAAFFHVSSLEPTMRDTLLRDFGEEGLPYNTYYGDGTAIEWPVIEEIRNAYLAEKVVFLWHKGDVMLLDNMTVAHAREPYRGDRKVVVAMTEPFSGSEADWSLKDEV